MGVKIRRGKKSGGKKTGGKKSGGGGGGGVKRRGVKSRTPFQKIICRVIIEIICTWLRLG